MRERTDNNEAVSGVSQYCSLGGSEGVPSNTPSQSSKWIGSEDWLEWNLYVDFDLHKFKKLRESLDDKKEWAKMSGDVPEVMNYISVNGANAEVKPTGTRMGKGRKGPYFPYILTYEGLTILISGRGESHKTMPNVVIRADGECCLLWGSFQSIEKGRAFVRAIGGTIKKEKISRVDICLDMPGIGMDEFEKADNEKRYVCRCKSYKLYKGTGTTIQYGESPLFLRVYDKKAEMDVKGNPIKKYAMKMYRWGQKEPNKAIRVEFEIRRAALKKRGIDSIEDYFDKRADLVSYLTNQWFRFTEKGVDRKNKNQSKAKTFKLWKDVQRAFLEWSGKPRGESLEPLEKENVNVDQLFKQIHGLGKAAAKHQGVEIKNIDELLQYVSGGIRKIAR